MLVTMTVMLSLSQEVWSPSKVGPVGPGLQYCTSPPGGRGQPREWFFPQQGALGFVTDAVSDRGFLNRAPAGSALYLETMPLSPLLQAQRPFSSCSGPGLRWRLGTSA